jgi:SAM-dependent methyltransferase
VDDKDRLKWIYSSRDNKELSGRYDQWAEGYDSELEGDYGWIAPRLAVNFVHKYVAKTARVLDAGAGTGLVGQCLYLEGYRDLVAVDLSEDMLAVAGNKKVYRELHQMVLGEPLNFPDDSFDAVVCVGVFTFGHAPPNSLDELVRLTRPQGYIFNSMRIDAYDSLGFKEKQAELESGGKWTVVEVSELFQPFTKKGSDISHRLWVYRIT